MKPPMTPVASDTIRAIGYREHTKELWVDFVSGITRVYHGVGPSDYRRLMSGSTAAKRRYLAGMVHTSS